MKIINKTHWRTDHIRAILQGAARVELEPSKRRGLTVEVTYTGKRRSGSSGCAIIGGTWARVRLPKGPDQPNARWLRKMEASDQQKLERTGKKGTMVVNHLAGFTPERAAADIRHNVLAFAFVACHEFAHIRGMRHAQMPSYYTWGKGWEDYVAWAKDLPLDVTPPKVGKAGTPADRASNNLSHVLKMETLALTRAKRATTILKKWSTKRKYYERRVAALAHNQNT
jgi:hypothetical protein